MRERQKSPRKYRKTQGSISISGETFDRLKKYADANDLSMAEICEALITKKLNDAG